jgi:hypothetical protein
LHITGLLLLLSDSERRRSILKIDKNNIFVRKKLYLKGSKEIAGCRVCDFSIRGKKKNLFMNALKLADFD